MDTDNKEQGFLIQTDTFHVSSLTRNPETGEKLAPEEVPAQRVLGTDAAVGGTGGETLGRMQVDIQVQAPLIDFATAARQQCMFCKHFDSRAWHALYRKMSETKEGLQILNTFRHGLTITENAAVRSRHQLDDDDFDVDHAMMACGICRPLTEIVKDPIIVYPVSTCPETLPPPTDGSVDPKIPFPVCFELREERQTERASSAAYDVIMQAALTK